MTDRRASDVLVRCLEAEGVRHVFGIPGEETLDLNHSLARSPIEFVPVRHEQAAAYMAGNPVVLAGSGVLRARAAPALREFTRATGIPVAETFMGKGALDHEDPYALDTVGLQERDYELAGFGDADVVIAVDYDLVEHTPSHWNPRRDKTIDAYYTPAVELLGACTTCSSAWPRSAAARATPARSRRRRGCARSSPGICGRAVTTTRSRCARRARCGSFARRQDVLVSDVGMHELWIARMFGAREPNTVLIANGLAGMGFALPSAIAAKLAHPDRRVVALCGDGGFLMNCQKLTDLTNPDFVGLAESFGMPAWRCDSAEDFGRRLRHALSLDAPSLILLPIDYSVDVALSDELGDETVIRT